MMWRVVQRTLMWLLAMALPLQGLAAATMMSCGAGQDGRAHSHVASHSHHHGELVAVLAHSHAEEASLDQHADLDQSQAGTTGLGNVATHKCSACASCCTSAAVSSQAILFDAVKLTDFFAPPVARPLVAYVTEGLERPPRSFLV